MKRLNNIIKNPLTSLSDTVKDYHSGIGLMCSLWDRAKLIKLVTFVY